ncbi:NFACT RNA binding domain-containing protein [Pullulanibacillus sp. KACC 23026]|uniref:Rqc2 family fibronectin-binding protein n=1 Tax=Pullulanibacillus sp. KACC 23026 TaxID=3028315 RepID=UPI0023B08056|nr:NFACT RNA binding domain-containing protein [Pullulanibacillus sp. KACC 23026]WEG11634.1 NFACT RNA binding domain-containing protein [Pullulanibacillus sp. KACC 23026]
MSFDGIVTHAIVRELNGLLKTGRIVKVYQPHDTDLLLHVRAGGTTYKWLISASAQFSRTHLTKEAFNNPKEPPMFCMVLRKHLEGAFIESIEQIGFERILHVHIKGKNEIGDTVQKKLIIELMGKHSNIMLVDGKEGMILDAIKRLSPSVNRYRTILPGRPYVNPPEQDKLNPLTIERDDLLRRLDFNAGKLDRQLVEHVEGFSPLLAREVLFRAGLGHREALLSAFFDLQQQIRENRFEPTIVQVPQKKEAFHVVALNHLGGISETYDSVSDMLDSFYALKAESDVVKQKTSDLGRFVGNELKKNESKLQKLRETLKETEEASTYQLYGELLTAHMHQVKKGDALLKAVNYYDPDQAIIEIPLDPNKTPSDNAQRLFKKYNKLKHAKQVVQEQIQQTEEEIVYLEHVAQQIESASLRDIEEIREELEEGGYVRKRRRQTKAKQAKPVIESYTAADGTTILVGKNNKQNDYLTMRLADEDNVWLHTKDIPGSHVVIRSDQPSDETLKEAAELAAFYSKSRYSSSVPVDYTFIKHVRKPNGAKPGFVIYDHQKTLYVTPDERTVHRLKNNNQ